MWLYIVTNLQLISFGENVYTSTMFTHTIITLDHNNNYVIIKLNTQALIDCESF